MSGLSLNLGLGFTRNIGSWWYSDAILDADFVNNRYRYAGINYSTKAAWLNAIGGSEIGGVITFPWTDNTVQIIAEARKHRPSADAYIYQLDDGTSNNRLFARHNNSNSQIYVGFVVSGTTFALPAMGPYGFGTTHKTVQSCASSSMFGTANGVTKSFATPGNPALPTITTCRIGGSASGEAWSGEIYRFTILTTPLPQSDVALGIAKSIPTYRFYAEGDSFVDGSGGVGVGPRLGILSRKQVAWTALGGSTITNIRDRIIAASTSLKSLPTIIWDGDANSYGTVSGYLFTYDQVISAIGHNRFVVVGPPVRAGLSSQDQIDYAAITSGLISAYGVNRVVDAMPILIAAGNPVADAAQISAGQVPASLLQDGVHLTDVAMNLVMDSVYAKLMAL